MDKLDKEIKKGRKLADAALDKFELVRLRRMFAGKYTAPDKEANELAILRKKYANQQRSS